MNINKNYTVQLNYVLYLKKKIILIGKVKNIAEHRLLLCMLQN